MENNSIDSEICKSVEQWSPTSPVPELNNHVDLEEQLWRYRHEFETLLDACLEVLYVFSHSGYQSRVNDAFRQCHHRLKLWSSGNYRQLVNDDTCEWNHGAQGLMNLVSLSLMDIAILLGSVGNIRGPSSRYCQTHFDSALTGELPRLVMEDRARMAWVHESDYHSRESQDMAYLAHIIESLYALLPAIRDLRKATLLREECFLQDVQLLHENHGHINDRPCKAPVRDENEHLATTTLAPATTDTPTYGSLGISHLINSLLEYAVSLWKEANYHAEEYQEVQISVSMFPTPQFSMGRLTYKDYAHTKARLRSPQFDVGQKARRQDRAADKTSGAQSLPVDASLIQLSQSKLERCEHALREDTKRRNAALGAGAAGLVLARMLLTRRARLRF